MRRNFLDSVQVLESKIAFQAFFGAFQNFNKVLEVKSRVKPGSLQPQSDVIVILGQHPINLTI